MTRVTLFRRLPGRSAANADASGLERFLAGEGNRCALVRDDQISSLPLPLILLGVGEIVLRFRGPDPPRRAESSPADLFVKRVSVVRVE